MKSFFLETLENLEKKATTHPLTLGQIFSELGSNGHLVLILFLCLPFMQPIPLPGLSTPLGLMIVFVAILNYLQKPAWLPKRLQPKVLNPKVLLNVLRVAEKIWNYVERILEPRWKIFFRHPFFKVFNTLVLCLQALLLCLPLPIPFSNNIPALGIAVNIIGELEEDGLIVLISYVLFLGSMAFFSGIAFGLESGWDLLKDY